MDKQTAIDLLDNLLGMVEDNHDSDYDTAIKMGIDAIKEKIQLSKEDATKDATFDYIDRQAAIDALRYAQHRFTVADEAGGMGTVKWSEDVIYFAAAERALRELPSAQPEKMQLSTEKTQLSEEDATKDATFDYIDRQAAIDSVCEYCEYYKNEKLIQTIKDLSSAQPEIIRCKDCKYWMRAYLSISGKHGCNVMRDYTAPDDYCFKAERKA